MRPLDDTPNTDELLPDLLADTRARTDRAKVTDALDAIDGALTDNIRPLTGAAAMRTYARDIGYLCGRGHFCFHADPDERGECGGKSVGTITLTFEPELSLDECDELLAEANASLANVYETWRNA